MLKMQWFTHTLQIYPRQYTTIQAEATVYFANLIYTNTFLIGEDIKDLEVHDAQQF